MAPFVITCLKDVNPTTDRWRIVARVLRRWNVYHKEISNEIFCISTLLVDEQGTTIQASIMNKNAFPLFDTFKEDHTFFIANFEVTVNLKDFKASPHPYKLVLNAFTYFQRREESVPHVFYNFFPVADIIAQTQDNHIDHLFDIIAFVCSVRPLEEYKVTSEMKTRVRLILCDKENNNVPCILYEQAAFDLLNHDLSNLAMPIVLVGRLMRIGFDEHGIPAVCSSYYATKISLNLDINQVKEFIASSKIHPTVTISDALLQKTPQSCMSNASASTHERRVQISDIPNQLKEEYFFIHCEVIKFETRHGWIYDGCSRCGTKPRNDNGKLYCGNYNCKGKQLTIVSKLRLNYFVGDNTGTTSVVFFDKLAHQLLGKSVAEMKRVLEAENRLFDCPDEVDSCVGSRLLLKLKLNNYNKLHPHSSIPVYSFSTCSDLLDQFNLVGPEVSANVATVNPSLSLPPNNFVASADGEKTLFEPVLVSQQVSLNNTDSGLPETLNSSEDLNTTSLDEIPISGFISHGRSKGKRKVPALKKAPTPQIWVPIPDVATSDANGCQMKNIKQEKK